MNLFNNAKKNEDKGYKLCLHCEREFKPDTRNSKRGWGIFCSKSCAKTYQNWLKRLKKNEKKKHSRNYRLAKLGI